MKKQLYKIRPKGWDKFIDVYVVYEFNILTYDEIHYIYYLKCKERSKRRYLLYWDNEKIVVSSELGKLSEVQFKIIAKIFTGANNLKELAERYSKNINVQEIENKYRTQFGKGRCSALDERLTKENPTEDFIKELKKLEEENE